MLTEHKVFTETELKSRCEIMLDNYCKTVVIEANTMVDMARKQILPAVEAYVKEVSKTAVAKKQFAPDASCEYEKKTVTKLSLLMEQILDKTETLEDEIMKLKFISDVKQESYAIRDSILPKMGELRAVADEAETLTADKYWPFPTYGELLFGVR